MLCRRESHVEVPRDIREHAEQKFRQRNVRFLCYADSARKGHDAVADDVENARCIPLNDHDKRAQKIGFVYKLHERVET